MTIAGTLGRAMLDSVHLLTADPSLGADLHEGFDKAARELTVGTLELAPGTWPDARWALEGTDLGLLVLNGWVAREVQLARRITCDLAGPGDLLLSVGGVEESLLPVTIEWSAVTPTRLAVVLLEDVRPWPEISRQLVVRAANRSLRLALEHAIVAVPGIDARIVMYLTHLSAYWGTVTPDGIVVAPPLSHERLAQLVGSRRPTVTSALGRLQQDGTVARRPDGAWVLRSGGDTQLPAHPALAAPAVDRRPAPTPGRAAATPSGRPLVPDPPALRFQALAARVGELEARRREHFDELLSRLSSVQEGAAEMVSRARLMRDARAARDAAADTAPADRAGAPSGPPPDAPDPAS